MCILRVWGICSWCLFDIFFVIHSLFSLSGNPISHKMDLLFFSFLSCFHPFVLYFVDLCIAFFLGQLFFLLSSKGGHGPVKGVGVGRVFGTRTWSSEEVLWIFPSLAVSHDPHGSSLPCYLAQLKFVGSLDFWMEMKAFFADSVLIAFCISVA